VHAPGVRGDRPLSVEEDLTVRPGEHAVTVRFVPEASATEDKTLVFEGTVQFERGRVVLITNDAGRLVTRSQQR
jgi:hypothetical protein